MEQPAQIVSYFELIQTILQEKEDKEKKQRAEQEFAKRERASNRGKFD